MRRAGRATMAAFAAVLAALLAAPAAAAGSANLVVLGFSPDGRFFAFEDWRENDSEGGFMSSISVIDDEKDARVHAPFSLQGEVQESSGAVRAKTLEQARPTLEKAGIAPGEPGEEPALEPADAQGHAASFKTGGRTYELRLSTGDVPREACVLREPPTTASLRLTLRGPGGLRVLHDDRGRVPRTRGEDGCVYEYRLRSVRVKGRYLVVLLDVEQPGYEGRDVQHMAVAAALSDLGGRP